MSALVIIRTPFQAWLVQKVLEEESIKVFDVLYFTQDNSEEDKYYYNKISSISRNSEYFFESSRVFSIASSVLFKFKSRKWYKKPVYDCLVCASIEALFITSLVHAYPESRLISFDDGTANINMNSSYHLEKRSKRLWIYQYLMNALPLKDLKKRIDRHYTIYSERQNIINSSKVFYLQGWTEKTNKSVTEDSRVYFLGAPFEGAMNERQIYRIEKYMKDFKVDFYVKHPRERKLLDINAKLLNKKGRIAEEAIIMDAQDASIVLVGWFSSVMLNIGPLCKECIVLLPKDSIQTPELFDLSKKSGLTPVLI